MITKIIINNFQSHRHTEIIADFNMTVIHGLSDSGKSAIRKALQCVINRKPFYLRNGEDSGYITIEFNDVVITREYKRVKNTKCPECKEKLTKDEQTCEHCGCVIPVKPAIDRYIVDGVAYEKFGTELPPEITSKMKMPILEFMDYKCNINFATQFEDMFFIGQSYDNVRNKMISGLVDDSEKIDALLKKMSSEKYEHTSSIRILGKELEEIELKISMVERDIQELKELKEKIDDLNEEIDKISRIISSINAVYSQLKSMKNLSKVGVFLNKYSDAAEKAEKFMDSISKNYEKVKVLSAINDGISKLKLRDVEIPSEFSLSVEDVMSVENLNTHITKLKAIQREFARLSLINKKIPVFEREQINSMLKSVEDAKNSIDTLNDIFTNITRMSELMAKTLENKNELDNARKIIFKKFKDDNPNLICPHRGDVYADECIDKFCK